MTYTIRVDEAGTRLDRCGPEDQQIEAFARAMGLTVHEAPTNVAPETEPEEATL